MLGQLSLSFSFLLAEHREEEIDHQFPFHLSPTLAHFLSSSLSFSPASRVADGQASPALEEIAPGGRSEGKGWKKETERSGR